MNTTLSTKSLSSDMITKIMNTIANKKYRVIYKYTNRKLVSIYFCDADVYNRLKSLLKIK